MKQEEKPLVNKNYLLKKFPGKGGWTFAEIPEVEQSKHSRFGWVRVKGFIDDYEIKDYHLQPMGNGKLFLPVKAEIRKKIKKVAGDIVRVVLYAHNTPLEVPEELILCLKMELGAYEKFLEIKESQQRAFIDWIYSAKTDETRVQRINLMMDKLFKGENLIEKNKD